MKIRSFGTSPEDIIRQKGDLLALVESPGDNLRRPCPDCVILCPCSQSTTCTCACSPLCEQCPEEMSSEPDRYPIEKKIVPLVYAMFTTGVCPPCWSCEGHLSDNGNEIIKIPRVWFYSRSTLYPRLIVEHTEDLKFKKKINNSWTVKVLSWGTGMDTRFSLEPDVDMDNEKLNLVTLQREAAIIAASLSDGIKNGAARYLKTV